MGLLKQIRSRRSKRRLRRSAKAAAAATSDAVGRGDEPLECHVFHEVSKPGDDPKHFRWVAKSNTEEGSEYGAEHRDSTSLSRHQQTACSGWTWMYSCFDWGYSSHQMGNNNKIEIRNNVDRNSDDSTKASTPYDDDDDSGESTQPSESRVDQILTVPAALTDNVSDITSIASSDGESESDSESDSDSDSSAPDERDNSREVKCKKKSDKSLVGYLVG